MGIFDILKRNKSYKEQNYISEDVLNTLDLSIRPLIKLCNDNGIHTFACCSGNVLEHEDPECVGTRGYLAFKDSKEARELLSVLLDFEDLDVTVISAPKEPYEYFENVIDSETFAVYFRNKDGENMQKVYDRFESSIKNKKVSKDNLRIINSLIKKFREQENDFEYRVEFNDILNGDVQASKCCVNIWEMYLFEDDKNVGNVELLSQDISHILNTSDSCSDIGEIFLPNAMGKNALPVLDLIKKQALSQRKRYTLSRDEAKKPYDEIYDESEFEYLGYDEEYEIPDEFDEDLDREFPRVSLDKIDEIFNNNDKRKIEDDDIII